MAPRPGRSSIGVRVRPNANDFIKDLERQLAGKKHTFYADVHANLKPANKEIAEWSRVTLKKIRAMVPVGANMNPATVALADWRRKQAGRKTNIKIGADLSGAYASVLTFRKVAGKDIEVNLKVNVESANKAAERFQQAIARRGINIPLDVNADVRKAANKIDTDLIRRFQGQGAILLGVDADTSPATRKIDEVKAKAKAAPVKSKLELEVNEAERRLTNLQIMAAAKKLGVKVDIDADPKRADMQLRLLRARAAANKIEVGVEVKRQGIDSFMSALSSIEKKLGGGSMIRSLDVGPLNLGKPQGLMGTLTTVNLLAGAMPLATFAVTGLSKAIMDLAGAASIAPGAIGGLLASVGTFAVGVSGVSEAISAMTDMWTEGAASQASTARRSVQAHNQLRQSVRDEAQAQRDVGSARREATNDLRNLNNELRGGVLNEAQAILDLQKAKDRYAQGDFDNATDRKQAELDILKAQDNIVNVRERNNQLQVKANEEGAKGVENSDKVQAALERQTRAAEATAQALEAIESSQATGTLGKFQDELAQLTPSAQEFVLAIAGFKGEMLDLRNMVQETMFAGTGPAFQMMFRNLLPVVGPGMKRIGAAMNRSILQVFDSLGSDQGQSIIERILGGTAEAQEGLTKLIDPVVRGVGTLMAAGAEHLPQVVDLFTRLADRFAVFIEDADRTGKLDEFMDRGIGALEKLAELGINLIQIVDNLGGAFKGDLLQGLVDITQKFEDWIVSAEGQKKINGWIEDAKKLWEDWKPVLQDLPEIFDAVSGAAKGLIDVVTPFINLFTSAMKEAPGLVQGFVGVWLGSKLISGFLSPVFSLLKGIIGGFKSLPGLIAAASNMTLPTWLGGAGKPAPGAPGTPPVVPGAKPPIRPPLGTAPGALGFLALLGPGLSEDEKDALSALPPEKQQEYIRAQDAKDGPTMKRLLMEAQDAITKQQSDKPWWQRMLGFKSGGYTDWGASEGKIIQAHGGEYIEPKPTVDHYGVDAMRAVHQKRATISYKNGGLIRSFQGGGINDDKLWVQPDHGQNTSGAEQGPGIIDTLASGAAAAAAHGASLVQQRMPGGAGPNVPGSPGYTGATGAAPGPSGSAATTAITTPSGTNPFMQGLFGNLGIPGMDAQNQQQGPGWPGDQAPPGLGGGDGFDIRRFGIGPGPVGSGPNDWLQHTGEVVGKFGAGLVSEFSKGLLGAFGLDGILNSPYFAGATGLLGHFLNPDQQGVQGPGADLTNAQLDELMQQYNLMPENPSTGAPGSMPTAFDPNTGSALANPSGAGNGGLQIKTLIGKGAIERAFPWATDIGGVRPDALKWHPSGLALDVMTDPGHENNDPPSPEGLAKGNQLYAWLKQNQEALGIDYLMWGPITGDADHYNHIHVNFAASGYPTGGGPLPGVTTTPVPGMPGAPGGAGTSAGGGGKKSIWPKVTTGVPSATKPSTGNPVLDKLILPGYATGGFVPMADPGRLDNSVNFGHLGASVWGGAGFGNVQPGGGPPIGFWGGPEVVDRTRNWPGPLTGTPVPGTPGDALPGPGQGGFNRIPHRNKVMDRGGVLSPGTTVVHNYTGKPELVIPAFAGGGINTGIVPRKPLLPRGPTAIQIKPKPPPIQAAPPPPSAPPADGGDHWGRPLAPQEAPPSPGVGAPGAGPGFGAPGGVMPAQIGPGPGPGAATGGGDHLNPAVSKGIKSGFAAAGNIAGMAAGAFGAGGASSLIAGAFGQAGKIVEGIANVGASFLVGTLTNGTTENPYGVTQRGSNPTGGTRIDDNSTHYHGDMVTNNLDEYFRRQDLREKQKQQASLGRFG